MQGCLLVCVVVPVYVSILKTVSHILFATHEGPMGEGFVNLGQSKSIVGGHIQSIIVVCPVVYKCSLV